MEGRAKGNGIRGAGRMWRRRYGEHRGGRGRGFKHRKRYIFKDRKLLGNYQDYQEHLPAPDETMDHFGADFQADYKSNQNLTDGTIRIEYRPGEGQGEEIGSDGGPAHFGVEASSGEEGMGVRTHTNEHGAADESVAVVGSTSCVAGPVVCEQCGLAFSSTQELAMHSLVSHRLYVCPCCGKHFSQFNILNRHMIVHRGVSKLHCCPLCHKTFTQKSTLCDHMNVHSGERPYVCAYCHVSFAHKSALRRHLMEQHGKTMPQNHMELQRNNEGGVGLGFKSYLNRWRWCYNENYIFSLYTSLFLLCTAMKMSLKSISNYYAFELYSLEGVNEWLIIQLNSLPKIFNSEHELFTLMLSNLLLSPLTFFCWTQNNIFNSFFCPYNKNQ